MMTFSDKVITFSLIFLAIIAMFSQGFFIGDNMGKTVVITVDGKEYARYDFSEIEKEITLDIKTEFGENTVKIDKNSAWVSGADCPDKLDVKAGKINRENQMIVCLPNRLMIEIKGNGKVDKVTY